MNQQDISVDVLILGNTLTGICLSNLLKGTLGNTCSILILDVLGDEQIYQDRTRYASLEHEFPIVRKWKQPKRTKSQEYDVEAEMNYKKIFIDENTNISQVENTTVFPFGDVFETSQIKAWLQELDTLSRCVPPGAVGHVNTPKSHELEVQLDNTNVRDHMQTYIKSEAHRKALEEMVFELCGVPANKVSMLFFLWIRKRSRMELRNKKLLNDSMPYKILSIKKKKDEKVYVETDTGLFVCRILAMAIKPSQIRDIDIAEELFGSPRVYEIISNMFHGKRRGFMVDYFKPFWKEKGLSGEIFSLSGIIRSTVDETIDFLNDTDFIKVYTLSGHIRINSKDESVKSINQYKDQVIDALVTCFGEQASVPLRYIEECYNFIEVPQLGDFAELLEIISFSDKVKSIEWSCLDIYNNCDIDNALMAAQKAYINIVYIIRPQAVSYEDIVQHTPKAILPENALYKDIKKYLWESVNYKKASIVIVTSAVLMLIRYLYKGKK